MVAEIQSTEDSEISRKSYLTRLDLDLEMMASKEPLQLTEVVWLQTGRIDAQLQHPR